MARSLDELFEGKFDARVVAALNPVL